MISLSSHWLTIAPRGGTTYDFSMQVGVLLCSVIVKTAEISWLQLLRYIQDTISHQVH